MKSTASVGVLCHLSSLPPNRSIIQASYDWIDYLHKIRARYWQILPLNPVSKEAQYSPYSSASAFALHVPFFENERIPFSRKAYGQFSAEHDDWLQPFAEFKTLATKFKTVNWLKWPHRYHHPANILYSNRELNAIEQEKRNQFLAHQAWKQIKEYANQKNIKIIGDLPFYVAHGSADVWSQQKLFKLKKNGRTAAMAGVPPDYFAKDGQLWGNPIYQWSKQKKNLFYWWKQRLQRNLEIYDVVRLDHFRAFCAYWQVPAGHKTARNGRWIRFPSQSFFEYMQEHFDLSKSFIAEDLGMITPAVIQLVKDLKIRNIKVFQFGFNGNWKKNDHFFANVNKRSIYYSGTHDNNTLQGWLRQELTSQQRTKIKDKFELPSLKSNTELIRLVMQSNAAIKIFQAQDFLDLDQRARMNIPGTAKGNWSWQLSRKQFKQLVRISHETKKLLSL